MVTLAKNESRFQDQLKDVSHRLQQAYPHSYKRVTNALAGQDKSTQGIGLSLSRISEEQKPYFYPVLKSATDGDSHICLDPVDASVTKLLQKNQSVPYSQELAHEVLARNSNLRKKLSGLDHSQIQVNADFVKKHPLFNFIAKPAPLVEEDFISLLESGFVDLQLLRKSGDEKISCGVLEASCGPSHGNDVWTRDMAAVALGKLDIGQAQFAEKIAFKLYEAYAGKPQRERINKLLANPLIWESSQNSNFDIPHTKFSVEEVNDTQGRKKDYVLRDCKQNWAMQQLDAYGYFLQLLARLAAEHKIDISAWDKKIQTSNDENKYYYFTDGDESRPKETESTMVALANMLCKIEYWKRSDFGAWEYPMHNRRASSLAACISGLKWVYKYFEQNGNFTSAPISVNNGRDLNLAEFKKRLEHSIKEGEKSLFELRIPAEETASSQNATEVNENGEGYDQTLSHKERHKDAALLLILMLSDPNMIGEKGLSEDQHFAILRTVYELMGEVGFKRFPTDEYMGMNWTTRKHPHSDHREHADNTPKDYKPAEWCFFDPYLATYFYKRFIKSITDDKGHLDRSKKPDIESYLIADRHARRSLAMISKANYCFFRKGHESRHWDSSNNNTYIEVPAGEAMEHYWYNTNDLHSGEPSEKAQWMPGENYRLNWTKIALQQMFFSGCAAGKLFKEILPNGWDQQPISGLDMSMAIKRGAFPTISSLQQRLESITETIKGLVKIRGVKRKP